MGWKRRRRGGAKEKRRGLEGGGGDGDWRNENGRERTSAIWVFLSFGFCLLSAQ